MRFKMVKNEELVDNHFTINKSLDGDYLRAFLTFLLGFCTPISVDD